MTYSRLSGSKQYDASFDASASVVGCINQIVKRSPKEASLGTKKSALETLRKIGKSICLSGTSTLGHEVRKTFQYDTCLTDAMYNILKTMSVEEREKELMHAPEGEKNWYEKVCELVKLAKGYCVFEGLADVVEIVEEKVGSKSVEDENEYGNEEEEEEREEEEGEEEVDPEGFEEEGEWDPTAAET